MNSIIENMKNRLVPEGTLPVVRLSLDNASYFDVDFVRSCIDELKSITLIKPISPLQKLALHVLMDSLKAR